MPVIGGPGRRDHVDPDDLDDLRRRVLSPVVSSVVREHDLRGADVGWGPAEPWRSARSPGAELWARVEAAGATFRSPIWRADWPDLTTLEELAFLLADRLEDWVCEDVYRGEQVVARVTIPARNT